MDLTKNEWAALCAIVRDAAGRHGEDTMGVILKTSGVKFLTDHDLVALAQKIDQEDLNWHREGWLEDARATP